MPDSLRQPAGRRARTREAMYRVTNARLSLDFERCQLGCHEAREQHPFGADGPSRSWWKALRRREPTIKLIKPGKIEKIKIDCLTTANLTKHFNELEVFVKMEVPSEDGLTMVPKFKENNVWDADEKPNPLDGKRIEKVVGDPRFPCKQVCGDDRTHCTLLMAICANGRRLPPAWLFPAKNNNGVFTENTEPGTRSFVTECGFSTDVSKRAVRTPLLDLQIFVTSQS